MAPNDRGDLGQYLWDLRQAAGLKSLREAEEKSGVSNAYISQIETGQIKRPSPSILSRLAEAYKAPYETLMELAGHIKRAEKTDKRRRGRLPTFAKEDLTDEEEAELLEYLAFLRLRKGRDKREKE
jgi:HTH-type transcriptional regulator, competence development regulator